MILVQQSRNSSWCRQYNIRLVQIYRIYQVNAGKVMYLNFLTYWLCRPILKNKNKGCLESKSVFQFYLLKNM